MNLEAIKKKVTAFWYYNKVAVCIGIVVALVGIDMLVTSRQIVNPDFSAALISLDSYSAEELEELENAIAASASDVNGDGRIKVELRYYPVNVSGEEDLSYDYIAVSKLEADLAGRVSGLFLVSDPEGFQRSSHMFAYLDGSMPDEEAADLENMVLPIRQISALDGAGHDNLYLGIRLDHPQAADYRALLDGMTVK